MCDRALRNAQTWSEHCVHKTFKAAVRHGELAIGNLLGETIAAATEQLDKPWCVSVFKDNAGIVQFGDGHNVAFKVETHNHPTAISPDPGAATGAGGEIQLTDALQTQARSGCVMAYKFVGRRFDCGSVHGFVEATNYFYERWKETQD